MNASNRKRRTATVLVALTALAVGATAGTLVARSTSTDKAPLLTDAQARLQAPTQCERVLTQTTGRATREGRCVAFTAAYVPRALTEPHTCRDEGGAPDGTWQQKLFRVPSLCRWRRVVDGRRVVFTGDQAVGYLPLIAPPAAATAALDAWATHLERRRTRHLPGHPTPKETTR